MIYLDDDAKIRIVIEENNNCDLLYSSIVNLRKSKLGSYYLIKSSLTQRQY